MNGNYGWGLPIAASSYAGEIDRGLWIIHIAMLVIFVLWAVFFVYLLVRYRRREGVPAKREHLALKWSLAPDAAVLIFEILLIAIYAIPGWSRIKLNQPPASESNVVEIVAEQFNWSARYPGKDGAFGRTAPQFVDFTNPFGVDPADPAGRDDVVAVNHLHLPVDKPTVARLTSKDVIHSFFIPEFRIKQDAVPGLAIPVWFKPTLTGKFEITCAQLCGVGHAIMRADVTVHSQEDFQKWLDQAATPGKAAEAAASIAEQW